MIVNGLFWTDYDEAVVVLLLTFISKIESSSLDATEIHYILSILPLKCIIPFSLIIYLSDSYSFYVTKLSI